MPTFIHDTTKFDEQVALIETKLSTTNKLDAVARYEIGVAVLALRDEAAYGSNAVVRAAERLGCTPALLYAYAEVAATWSRSQFESALETIGTQRVPLTWSHFVELTGVADDRERAELLLRARTASWSVRDLQRAIAGAKRRPTLPTTKQKKSVVDAFRDARATPRLVRKIDARIADLAAQLDELRAVQTAKKAELEGKTAPRLAAKKTGGTATIAA